MQREIGSFVGSVLLAMAVDEYRNGIRPRVKIKDVLKHIKWRLYG